MAELLIRPGHNDHVAIANLLIPAGRATLASVRRPISRLVVDAHLAHAYPQYREAAAEAGTPLIIDPRTDLLQVDTDPRISWRKLPYASDAAWGERIANPFDLSKVVQATVDFQVKHGASAIVSPYFYAKSIEDPAVRAKPRCEPAPKRLTTASTALSVLAVAVRREREGEHLRNQLAADRRSRFVLSALDVGLACRRWRTVIPSAWSVALKQGRPAVHCGSKVERHWGNPSSPGGKVFSAQRWSRPGSTATKPGLGSGRRPTSARHSVTSSRVAETEPAAEPRGRCSSRHAGAACRVQWPSSSSRIRLPAV
jgi:hypothetical protein